MIALDSTLGLSDILILLLLLKLRNTTPLLSKVEGLLKQLLEK